MSTVFFHFAVLQFGLIFAQFAFFTIKFVLERFDLLVQRRSFLGDLSIARFTGGVGAGFHEVCLAHIGTGKDFEGGIGTRSHR